MKKYLESILRMDVRIDEPASIYSQLPLLYKGTYNIFIINSGGIEWLAMQPKTNVGLSQLRKNRAFIEKTKQLNVALFLEKASLYSKDKMIEEGY